MAGKAKRIRCPICRQEAELVSRDAKLFNGGIILKSQPIYRCRKCKEEFATSGQVDKAVEQLKKAFFFKRQIISTGGSLAITLPSDLSRHYNLKKGKSVYLIPESGKTLKIVC